MNFNNIITLIMLVSLIIGALDYILDNKFGLAKQFEEGIMTSGRLMLCMAGFMVLAPLIAQQLGPIVAPFFRSFGADPSIIAGMLLANDAGGATLAMELADNAQAGLFSGLIVGATMGTTVMLSIPTCMAYATKEERPTVIYGTLCGIATIPLACLAGGFVAGFPPNIVLPNTLPVIVISAVLLGLLLMLGEKIVPAFAVVGKVMVSIAIFGLACGAIEHMTGYMVFKGMSTLDTVFPVVGGIAVFLAGAFTLLAIIRKTFAGVLTKIGSILCINNSSVSALLMCLANGIPPILMIHEMDDKGRILNVALLSSASCIIGDHLAFTAQVAPQMCTAVVVGKAVGGITAFFLALALAPRLLKSSNNTLSTNKDLRFTTV